ncbi:BTAD domain-containing putative transcriptional regulator [Streptomyces xiamenensis]|uniref:BTAD domain-containing putative transcriptional regulator n=1 Tax=Streptomyces xiamenensis TaxID=408015 RepID=UPI0035DC658A
MDLLRALLSVVLIVALLVGVPVALWVLGTLPQSVPSLSEAGDALTQPDDGSLLLVVLTLVGWGLWLAVTYALVLEAGALLRRRTARRRRGLGGVQSMAAWLLGSLVTLSTPAIASAAVAPAAVAAPVQEEQIETGTPAAEEVIPSVEPELVISEDGMTLWDVAEEHLGSGQRWSDIAVLNPGIEADQDRSGVLRIGTTLSMPSSWMPAPASEPTDVPTVQEQAPAAVPEGGEQQIAAQERGGTDRGEAAAESPDTPGGDAGQAPEEHAQPGGERVTVEAGDSLWELSERHLGDPTQWPAVYQENQQVIGDDPDLILPGQELTIEGSKLAEPDVDPAPDLEEPAPEAESVPETPAPEQPGTEEEAADATGTPGGQEAGEDGTALPDASEEAQSEAAAGDDVHDGPSNGVAARVLALSGTGALAAGVLGMVTRHRRLQQRSRRPGRRIAKPTGEAAATEQALRYVEIGDQLGHVQRALQTAAVNLAAAERELPVLVAVSLTPRGATLHLAEPAEVISPFVPVGDLGSGTSPKRWYVASGNKQVLPAKDLEDVEAPYPSLVTIGRSRDGDLVLVDLEQVGVVHLTGERRRETMRTIAAELACSELADDMELALVGAGLAPGLDQLGIAERLTPYDSVAGAVPVLASKCREQQDALTAIGAQHLRQARLNTEIDGAWSPLIILADSAFTSDASDDEEALTQLLTLVSREPRAAAAVVISGTPVDEADGPLVEGVWMLSTDPGVTVEVPGTDLTVVIEPLSDEDYEALTTIAAVALTQTDVPAPAAVQLPGVDLAKGASPQQHSDVETGTEPGVVPMQPGPEFGVLRAAPVDEQTQNTEIHGAEEELASTPAPAGPGAVTGLDLLGGLASYSEDADESGQSALVGADADSVPVALEKAPTEGSSEPATPAAVEVLPPLPLPAVEQPEQEGPMIRVLGPVDIIGARGNIASSRRRTVLEAAAWLALHPGSDRFELDEALWPGMAEVPKGTRNPRISQVRAWLGRDDNGDPFLRHLTYQYSPAVRCDWDLFQQHVAAAAGQADVLEAEKSLAQALGLVRGRPFTGIDPRRYVWAEHLTQDMISAIVDAAADLAEFRLERGAAREALWAATKGLECAPEAETLHRIAFRAHHALGDMEGLERAAGQLDMLLTQWSIDMEGETAILLGQLLNQPAAPTRGL